MSREPASADVVLRSRLCRSRGGARRWPSVAGRRYRGKEKAASATDAASMNNPGSDLLSHAVSHAVPSAVAGLTSVFGMGTGVTLLL